jgi:hypothetical protein
MTGPKASRYLLPALCWALASAVFLPAESAGQAASLPQDASPTRVTGTISGTVLGAYQGGPLSNATVSLSRYIETGSDPAPATTTDSIVHEWLTGPDGRYNFSGIRPGSYQLRIRRIGFNPASVVVSLGRTADLTLSLALEVAPVHLEPVEVKAAATDLYREPTRGLEADRWREGLERWRQERFLTSDVQLVTTQEAGQAIPFAGGDPLRSLHRGAGVGTRDDWTAELWTRGSRFDLTRIVFDGVPLFNPTHAAGFTSAINQNALGAVALFPGVRPAGMGEGGAGMLVVESRPVAGPSELSGVADLTLVGGGVTMQRGFAGGRAGLLLGARGSGLKSGEGLLESTINNTGPTSFELPREYADLTGRFDLHLGGGAAFEASGLWMRDRVDGFLQQGDETQGVLNDNQMSWGNAAGRASLILPAGHLMARHTLGVSRYQVSARSTGPVSQLDLFNSFASQPETDSRINYTLFRGDWSPAERNGPEPDWSMGYEVNHQEVFYDGPPSSPYPLQVYLAEILYDENLTVASLWGQRRWGQGERFTYELGVRVEGSRPLKNSGPIRIAPRASARYRLSERWSATAAAGRHYQYMQAFAPAGLRVGPGLAVSHRWFLANDQTPALQTDLVSLGSEYWLDQSWLVSANLYLRSIDGMVIPNPTPGPVDVRDELGQFQGRRHAALGQNDAYGIDLALRKLAGPITASVGYSYGASTMTSKGLRFPSSEDRAHTMDVSALWRTPLRIWKGGIRTGFAVTAASGAPYTRVHPGNYTCDQASVSCSPIVSTEIGAPNAQRTAWYASTDALVEWQRPFSSWRLDVYFQVRNVLNSPNAVSYTVAWSDDCHRLAPGDPYCSGSDDRFESGMPRMALFGFRVGF